MYKMICPTHVLCDHVYKVRIKAFKKCFGADIDIQYGLRASLCRNSKHTYINKLSRIIPYSEVRELGTTVP